MAGVNWAALRADAMASLAKKKREVVGASWRGRREQEHLAVGAFALITQELAAVGCSDAVLSLVTCAANDEVRHAETCKRFAAALLGDDAVPARVRGVPRVPMHDGAPPRTRALLHVVEMCCVNETLTGVYLTEMLARTTNRAARAAVRSLLADEIDHGRAGWAYLAERAQARDTAGLAEALPKILERSFRPVLEAARAHPDKDDRAKEAFGYLGRRASAAIYRRALDDVILPGFEALDIGTRTEVA